MKSIISFLLFSIACFSQNEISDYIKKTDSICKVNGSYGNSDGKISIKNKKGKIVGNGRFGIATYLNFSNNNYYNSLSDTEKKKYKRENSELIKSSYTETIKYIDGSFMNVYGEFYYQNNSLFYVSVKVSQSDKIKKVETETFGLSSEDIKEGKPIKNLLLFDVQHWSHEKNIAILEFYNQKF